VQTADINDNVLASWTGSFTTTAFTIAAGTITSNSIQVNPSNLPNGHVGFRVEILPARPDTQSNFFFTGSSSFNITGLASGTEYTITVYSATGSSENADNLGNAVLNNIKTLLAPPTGLATSNVQTNSITLGWTKSTGATGYDVRRGNGSWSDVGDVDSHTFTGLTANTQYSLQVRAKDSRGSTTGTAISQRTLPAAPTGVSINNITTTSMRLNWTKSSGATSYEVRQGSGGTWTDVGDVASRDFTGLTSNTQYTLYVRAVRGTMRSAHSFATATTQLTAATGLSIDNITSTSMRLNWTKTAGATSYEVRRDNGSWSDVGDVASHTFTGLSGGTQYTLYVRAKTNSVTSAPRSAAATTLPALPDPPDVPTGLTTSDITATSIRLNWSRTGNADSYDVRLDGGSWRNVGDSDSTEFTGLSGNTDYILQVRAVNTGGHSGTSQTTARTLVPPRPARVARADDDGHSSPPPPTPVSGSTCRLLPPSITVSGYYDQTQCQQVDASGVGIGEVLAHGFVDAVDIWSWVPPRLLVCFAKSGSLVFLDAKRAPRMAEPLDAFARDGRNCTLVDRAGTVVLLQRAMFASSAAVSVPGYGQSLQSCEVSLRDILNMRDAPGGEMIMVLLAGNRLPVLERAPGWVKVRVFGRQGWVSADYVDFIGEC